MKLKCSFINRIIFQVMKYGRYAKLHQKIVVVVTSWNWTAGIQQISCIGGVQSNIAHLHCSVFCSDLVAWKMFMYIHYYDPIVLFWANPFSICPYQLFNVGKVEKWAAEMRLNHSQREHEAACDRQYGAIGWTWSDVAWMFRRMYLLHVCFVI